MWEVLLLSTTRRLWLLIKFPIGHLSAITSITPITNTPPPPPPPPFCVPCFPFSLESSGKAPIWKAASADVARAEAVLAKSKESFVNQAGGGGEAQQAKAKAVLEQEVGPAMARLKEATKLQDFPATAAAQLEAAQGVATVRELMATQKGFQAASGYTVPQEYSSTLPVLEGRATVELKFKTSSNR